VNDNSSQSAENKGAAITTESFRIIRSRLGSFTAPEEVMELVIRIAHTTGDVEFGKEHHIPPEAVRRGIEAALGGCNIISDVEMVKTGIRRALADSLGCSLHCFLNDPEVVETSRGTGDTRSALGMEKAGKLLDGAIVAIGNAPTALFRLMEMIDAGTASPALVVGVPVGFVGALESKQVLHAGGYSCITNLSERGGSPIAAAIVNGILHLAAAKA
jgi:precorrin-8X/cobalt-precorrin-8 methylmutase